MLLNVYLTQHTISAPSNPKDWRYFKDEIEMLLQVYKCIIFIKSNQTNYAVENIKLAMITMQKNSNAFTKLLGDS